MPTDESLRVTVAEATLHPSAMLEVRLANGSSETVGIGLLACMADVERLEAPGEWRRISLDRHCELPLILVPPGKNYDFAMVAPDEPGTYRVVFEAGVENEQLADRNITLRSNKFEVLPGELRAEPLIARVAAGAELPVRFTNGTSSEVTTGELSCVTEYDKLTSDGWKQYASLRQCIAIARMVEAGSTFDYITPAPENAGTYRVSIRASRDGENVTVNSQSFEVY
jgi:hypothetical protein